MWVNVEQIDFNTNVNSLQRPTFRLDYYLLGELINPNRLRENWVYVRKNLVEIEDAQIQFGNPDREDTFFDIWKTFSNDAFAPKNNK